MSKFIKRIFMGVGHSDEIGPYLKATVAASTTREPDKLPDYVNVYVVTPERAVHFERILLEAVQRKTAELETTDDLVALSSQIVDLLKTVVMVAKSAEIFYNRPMSDKSKNAIEVLQLFQILALKQEMEMQHAKNTSVHGNNGGARPNKSSFFGRTRITD